METKTLKIEVPNGYEIDKEKSTFENIVFKKVDDIVIKWNECHNGVEIKADGEHFILDSNPTYIMNWNDAKHFYNNIYRSNIWNLPTIKQLQVVQKYFNEINKVIKENGGFILLKGTYWSINDMGEFCAWLIYMFDGYVSNNNKNNNSYVRAVYTL